MADFEHLLQALDEMPTHQLEQFNRLMEAFRRYLPRENLTPSEINQRAHIIGHAVMRLRAGMTDSELDSLIGELRNR
jgi:tRNA C32,U32 (ribose-2'-O)-methylase TrmJ